MPSLEDRLAALNDDFRAAPTGGSYDMPPDGDYQAIVDSFDHFESQKGELFLKTILKIELDPEYAGRQVEIIHNLTDPERLNRLKGHLQTLGLNPDEIEFSQLMSALHDVLDVPVLVRIKTGKMKTDGSGEHWRSAYVNRRLGEPLRKNPAKTGASDVPTGRDPSGDPGPEDGDPGLTPDSDIPFRWDGPRDYDQRYRHHR